MMSATLPSGLLDRALSDAITRALGVELTLTVATEPAVQSALTEGEVDCVTALATKARREEWRLGRAALKAALRAIGENDDTAPLRFPNRRVSLTHSGSTAVAVVADRNDLAGVGVDLEMDRAPRLEAARFFLTEDEQRWLRAQPETERRPHIVRLWTIKEAVFKADLENGSSVLRDYVLANPAYTSGTATRNQSGRITKFNYVTLDYVTQPNAGGTLSVATYHSCQRAGAFDTE